MAVAVKNTPETASERAMNRLAVGSLAGTLYVLGSLAAVFYGIPAVWSMVVPSGLLQSFVGLSLLSLVMLAAATGLCLLGVRLIGTSAPHGVRAGIFVGIVGILFIGLIACAVGHSFEGGSSEIVGIGLTILITAGMLIGGMWALFRPGFDRWLVQLEEQGWFSAVSYKKSQGQRVRRGTILAILVLGGCGIYTLLSHNALKTGEPSWGYRLPFVHMVQLDAVNNAKKEQVINELQKTENLDPQRAAYLIEHLPQPIKQYVGKEEATDVARRLEELDDRGADEKRLNKVRISAPHQLLVVLPHVQFTLPILLAAGCLWLAYRIVNYPTFADFLIATEAELNKVSWTTRKRLVQDTIVVLTTVLLMTLFLFVVDVLWFKILSSPWIQVIQTSQSTTGETAGQEEW